MANTIIDSFAVKEFLQQQGAELIYNSVKEDITYIDFIEVWLQGSSLISLNIDPQSNILESAYLYYGCNVQAFCFYNHDLNVFQKFCTEVQTIDATPVDTIEVSNWKDLLKVFGVGKDYDNDLNNASALVNALQKVYSAYASIFNPIRDELQNWIDDSLATESPFQPGDLLRKANGKLYRYLGGVDASGNHLFYCSEMVSNLRFYPLVDFNDCEVVDTIPFFEETVKGFSDIFNADFIKSVVSILSSFVEMILPENTVVDQICKPFQELVAQKHPINIEKQDRGGYKFCIEVASDLIITGHIEILIASISIDTKENGRFYSSQFTKGILNPLVSEKNYGIKSVLQTVLDFLSSIYKTFSYEIAKLSLTDPFIDLYGLWHQLYTVADFDYEYGKTVYQELYKALAPKELQPIASAEAHTVDAFSSSSFSSFGSPFHSEQKKTVIEANDTPLDAILKMSEGVPGAIVALNSLMQHSELVEPAHPFFEILALDSAGIRGSDLYTLFTYCCENSITNYRLVSLNRSHGNLSIETIKEFIRESKSFFRNRDTAGMENFQDWSTFDDCYPDVQDSYFDPGKGKYCTWSYSWENATDKDLVAIKIVVEEDSFDDDSFTEDTFTDTENGMPWEDFVNLALDQEFKFAYDGLVQDDNYSNRHECFMYREDGLILYANSFWDGLNHAVVFGEVFAASKDIMPLDLGSYSWGKSGSCVFATDVRDGMVSFLNKLSNANLSNESVSLCPVWTEKRNTMDILTEIEHDSVGDSVWHTDGSYDDGGYNDLIMKKLSLCCEEAKRIMAPMFEDATNNNLTESKPKNKPLKNLFNKLRR